MLTPDGVRYLSPSRPYPFHWRWLLPTVCGQHVIRWRIVAWVSAVAVCVGTAMYSGVWWAAFLPLGLAGVVRFNVAHPVLVDLPAMALTLLATVAAGHGYWWVAVLVVLVAGCIKETAPVFAALWAWHPLLLVGLIPVGVRAFWRAGEDPCGGFAAEALEHPFRASLSAHRPLPVWVWVLPWGVCLAALCEPSWQLWATLAAAYAQCVMATDVVRLYQWAFPVMVAAAVPVLGPWALLAVVVHLASPFQTEGV